VGVAEELRSPRQRLNEVDAVRLRWLEAAVDLAYDAVIVTTPDLDDPGPRIEYVNRAFTRMTGYSSDEVIGRSPRMLQGPATSREVLARLRRQLERGEPFAGEAVNYRKDGSTFDAEWRIDPIRDPQGQIRHWIALERDISDRKRAEQRLAAEERASRQLLELHDRERQLMAYEIHDGLVQDIWGAQMLVENARRLAVSQPRALDPLLDEIARHLSKATDEGRRLVRELRPMVIDRQGLISATEDLLKETSHDGSQINFQHDVHFERLVPLLEGSLFRIIHEGLHNALRHGHPKNVNIRLCQSGDRLRLEIDDDGAGFDPASVSRDRFGLEGIRQRARFFGGTAAIESTPGHGTRVIVDVPVIEAATGGA
jgi:PAS domain S-box-containing protein